MDQHNPYEAPQTAEFANPMGEGSGFLEQALGPEWRTVCAGAQKCYLALVILFVSLLLFVVGTLLMAVVLRGAAPIMSLLGIAFFVAAIVAVIYHFIGLVQYCKISPTTGAKGLMKGSMITYVMTVAGFLFLMLAIVVFAVQSIPNQVQNGPPASPFGALDSDSAMLVDYGATGIGLLSFISSVLLFLGMRKTGISLNNRSISTSSVAALVLYVVLAAGNVIASLVRTNAPRAKGIDISDSLYGLVYLITCLVMCGLYGTALKKIADYAKTKQQ